MNRQNNKLLDKLISRVVGRENLKFDFSKWKVQHIKEIQEFQAQAKHSGINKSVQVNIWRIIVKSRITKFAAAAVIIIAVLMGIYQITGSIDGASVALAETVSNMKKMSWVHTITEYEIPNTEYRTPRGKGTSESWINFEPLIWAAKGTQCGTEYINYSEDKQYSYSPYDPYSNKIVICPVTPMNDPANHQDSPIDMIETVLENANKYEGKISRKISMLDGIEVEIIHIIFDYHSESGHTTIYRDIERNLLIRMDRLYTIPKNLSKTIRKASNKVRSKDSVETEASQSSPRVETHKYISYFDYPEEGPTDIYDLGTPRDAEIEDYCPSGEVADLFSKVRQYRQKAYEGYIAILLENVILDDIAENQIVTLMRPTGGSRYRYMLGFKLISWFHPCDFISGYTTYEMLPADSEHEGLVGFRAVQTQKTILYGETERRKIIDEYWLDPERDYLVMEHVYFGNGNSLRWDIGKRTITLATQQTPDGQWYPSHISYEWEYTDDTGQHKQHIDKQITLVAEPLIPDDDFRAEYIFNDENINQTMRQGKEELFRK